MAKSKDTKGTSGSTRKAQPNTANGAGLIEIGGRNYTRAGLEAMGRRAAEDIAALEKRIAEGKEDRARREKEESEPVVIPRERLDLAMSTLDAINLGADSCYDLAINASDCGKEPEACLNAIQAISILATRRIDMVVELLTGEVGFGNRVWEVSAKDALEWAALRKSQEDRQ